MTTIKIWPTGELERQISNLHFPEMADDFFDAPIKWESEFLPSVGDEINWLSFVNTENFSVELLDVLETLSYNSYVTSKFWSKEKSETLCALSVAIHEPTK
jgi:hypothetical protein